MPILGENVLGITTVSRSYQSVRGGHCKSIERDGHRNESDGIK